MADDLYAFNGVNAETGKPALADVPISTMVEAVVAAEQQIPAVEQSQARERYAIQSEGVLGVRFNYTPANVDEVGWGLIIPPNLPADVRAALDELVAYRQGRPPFIYDGVSAYDFRKRHGQDFGLVDPDKLPYYLLIVGSPEQIPFDFQYDLDCEHAVGRLDFAAAADYRRYVRALIDYESGATPARDRRAAFFSPVHPDDKATALSSANLAAPLAAYLQGRQIRMNGGGRVSYAVEHKDAAAATRASLVDLLTRSQDRPALLFNASHGLVFSAGHPQQVERQGAILCQEWPGPEYSVGPVASSMYLAGPDLSDDVDLSGMVVFNFACFSAGTPRENGFKHYPYAGPAQRANQSFSSRLACRMLRQGALAYIGHVDLVWSYSFQLPGVSSALTAAFEDALAALLGGFPAGYAMESFSQRYLEANNALTRGDGWYDQYKQYAPIDAQLLLDWTARNDARSYVLYGDPAARLR
jgi:hypothetical protein